MSLVIKFFFHFFYVQHVSDINTSIIRSLRLFHCIITLVVFLVSMCWSFGVASDIKLVFYSQLVQADWINPLKARSIPKYILRFSSYCSLNALRLNYKNQ